MNQRRRAEDVAHRLLEEIQEFLAAIEAPKTAVRRACLYGGVLDARGVTSRLSPKLGVEVDILDTLFGIDDAHLPESGFREKCAELRLAWVAAAAWPPTLNLTRPSARDVKRSKRLAVLAGIATGVLAGWQIDRTAWWQDISSATVAAATGKSAPAASSSASNAGPGPGAAASAAPRGSPPPFKAVLGTIFYSPERPVALVDGRIVGVGDRVRDTEVVGITDTAVTLRDRDGRTWQLTRSASQ